MLSATIWSRLFSPMNDLLSNPITWVVLTAVSEIIGMSKLKDNSIVELVLRAVMQLKPKTTR